MQWNDIVQESSALVKNKEKYQFRLGELVYIAYQERGPSVFQKMADEIEETEGIKISHRTLRNKKWVYEKTKDLGLPPDITYRVLQVISGTPNPMVWAKLITKHGYSGPEVVHLIREEKGYKKKVYVCYSCGTQNTL